MKICSKCKKNRRLSSFANKGKGKSSYCKFCHRIYCKQHYGKNKGYYARRNTQYRGKLYEQLKAIKEASPCKDCRLFYPACVMDFDHIIGVKMFNIGSAVYSDSKSWDRVEKEIQKCELVCANCHRVRTYHRKRRL